MTVLFISVSMGFSNLLIYENFSATAGVVYDFVEVDVDEFKTCLCLQKGEPEEEAGEIVGAHGGYAAVVEALAGDVARDVLGDTAGSEVCPYMAVCKVICS